MRYDLKAMTLRATNTRRSVITFRPVQLSATLAGDLYATAYKPVIEAWTAGLPAINAAYERSLSELTTDSPEEIGTVMTATENGLLQVLLTLRMRLERWARNTEAVHRSKWRGAVLTATKVDIGTMIGPEDMRVPISTAIQANVGLVKSVSDEARQKISNEVFEGLRARKPARDVASAIREKVAMSRRRALNIASDQLVKLGESLNEERRREAGLSIWQWNSSHKLHYRPEHAKRDGKRYDDDAKSGEHKPPEDRPGMLPFCGCGSQAVLSLTGEF